jgi:hypothetical protein
VALALLASLKTGHYRSSRWTFSATGRASR